MSTCEGSSTPLVREYRPSRLHQLLVTVSDIVYKCQNVPRFFRAVVLVCFIIVGSVPKELGFKFPQVFMVSDQGFFNQFVLERCLLWTLIFLCPFITFLNAFRRPFSFYRLGSHMLRVALLIFNWASTTSLFTAVERFTESCTDADHCVPGYRLSGHTYVLVYFSCCIAEECTAIESWRKFSEKIGYDVQTGQPGAETALRRYGHLDIFVRVLLILLCALGGVWLLGLLITVLYYHVLVEKLLGCIFAMSSWTFTYIFWFGKPLALPAPKDILPREVEPTQDLETVEATSEESKPSES